MAAEEGGEGRRVRPAGTGGGGVARVSVRVERTGRDFARVSGCGRGRIRLAGIERAVARVSVPLGEVAEEFGMLSVRFDRIGKD